MNEVRIRRKKLGLSMEKLAQRADLSKQTIANIESGADARVGTMRKIALALGCTLDDLYPSQNGKKRRPKPAA